MATTQQLTTTTTNYTGGNSKYMANGVNHGYSHCIIDTTNNFIVAYCNDTTLPELLKAYNNTNYIGVHMLSNTKVNTKVQSKLQQKQQKLQQKLEQLNKVLNN